MKKLLATLTLTVAALSAVGGTAEAQYGPGFTFDPGSPAVHEIVKVDVEPAPVLRDLVKTDVVLEVNCVGQPTGAQSKAELRNNIIQLGGLPNPTVFC